MGPQNRSLQLLVRVRKYKESQKSKDSQEKDRLRNIMRKRDTILRKERVTEESREVAIEAAEEATEVEEKNTMKIQDTREEDTEEAEEEALCNTGLKL